jgi:signal transduction histidine kinase/putative methionine-R-sulfoxide reductase with GAF domain
MVRSNGRPVALGRNCWFVFKGLGVAMQSEVPPAIADQDRDPRFMELERELAEGHRREAATAEVLRVIRSSPTKLQPVFDTIVRSSVTLCDGLFSALFEFDGELIHQVAHHNFTPEALAAQNRIYPARPTKGLGAARAILERSVVHIPDAETDLEFQHHGVARTIGFRSGLFVPMLRESVPVGVIMVARAEPGPFSDNEIELLKTFADQAVIAIENTRLFEEVQARTRELSEALEQQAATSEVLEVISASPDDLKPVFQTMLENAVRICDASFGVLFRFRNDGVEAAAMLGVPPAFAAFWQRGPQRPGPRTALGRVEATRRTVHIADVTREPAYVEGEPVFVAAVNLGRFRTILNVPMLKENELIGAFAVYRQEVRPFTNKQIELVEIFANQAVIAINNVGLFQQVQARNSELGAALEQQTATSELLKVIGRSNFVLQPVFDTLAENAIRLCDADRAMIFRFDGENLQVVAAYNISPELRAFHDLNPIAPSRGSCVGRMALERRTIHIHDVRADTEYTYGGQQIDPYRTSLAVPMLRAGDLMGAINIVRYEVLPFTESQIALMETFADQAVIAIENTRLFEEVQALGEVGRAVSSTLDLKVVLKTIVDRAVDLSGTDGGSIFYYREEVGVFELGETSGLDEEVVARFRKLDISTRETGLGEVITKRQPLQIPDILKRASNPLRDVALEASLRAALIVPLLGAEGPLGALLLQRRQPGEFPQAVVDLMQTFADQSAIAIENARLFEKIAQKSRELEIASQHKSQFVANMSHELRTPLAAILGYAELMQEGFYEPLGQKSMDALTRIRSNGKHLLGLINTVLDIAKIESGQFSLNLSEYALESVVETVHAATESLAKTKKLALRAEVAKNLPVGLGDEQRLTQVLLNLVGNAIKFTDTGEVRIIATAVNGHFTVAVTDTGPGIPPEELKRVFDQFHQIDNSNTKAKGGTGLGLAIAKQIVEMHGGRIWVESTLGKGATFQMELPVRAQNARAAT